jgi:sugar phosphate isomerase/epimerase
MIDLGCHAVLFGEQIKSKTDFVLAKLAETGFAGVEIGYRFFGDNVGELAERLQKAGLKLSGFHVGMPYSDWLNKADEKSAFLENIAAKINTLSLDVMPRKNIVMSASFDDFAKLDMRVDNPSLVKATENLDRCAAKLADAGVALCYHNHAAEFRYGAAVYSLRRDKASHLCFGFDLGWVEAGGGSVEQVLRETKGRCAYAHLRDVEKGGEDSAASFAELGAGASDLSRIIAAVKTAMTEGGWLVVEYETGEQDFGRYTLARNYLRRYFD